MSDLFDRFLAHVRASELFDPPGTAVVAVSGGADSLVLLDLMVRARDPLGLTVAVAHVDHGIHPRSGDAAAAVQRVAARLGVTVRIAALGLGPGVSETRARHARYEALARLRGEARWLVTAHHADDQVETILYRVLRGSGVAGLAGMPGRREDGLIRPLLPFARAELEGWLDAPGREWLREAVVEDPENLDLRHDRVWVRRSLLPELRARFGDEADRRLLRVGEHAAADRAAWAALVRTLPELEFERRRGVVQVARAPLGRYDPTLSLAILKAVAREAGVVVGPARAGRLSVFVRDATSGRRFELGGGWTCEIAFDRVRLLSPEAPAPDSRMVWGNAPSGRAAWGPWTLSWSEEPAGPPARRGWSTWVTPGEGIVRPPEPGDRMRPLGGVGRRSVRRELAEAGVPRSERGTYPVLERDNEILWVPGVCRADVAVPAPGTRAVRLDATSE